MTPVPRHHSLPSYPPTAPRPRSEAHRRSARSLATATAAAVLVLAPVAAASAHVRVHPDSTAAGGYAALTFRVPTESATASTTAVSVQLPTGTPFTSVLVEPVAGWTAQVTDADLPKPVDVEGATITKAPSTVTWTASPGAAITPGQYQDFSISVGPLPQAGTTVLMPAAQTYSDGSVVRWDQPSTADGQGPEHPAPALTTTAAAGAGAATATASPNAQPAVQGTAIRPAGGGGAATVSGSHDTRAQWLGAGGLVLGAVALVVALAQGRRPASPRA